jgi:histidinol dehydrogenase
VKRTIIQNSNDLARAVAAIRAYADESEEVSEIEATVSPIVRAVKARGDEAVAEFTAQFDGVDLAPVDFEVNAETMDESLSTVDPNLLQALERAHDNITQFHEKNLRQSWQEEAPDGSMLGQRITAMDRVGLYVPGGKAFYPSSVLMNIVPARVAGVEEIIVVSPPSYQGGLHPLVLAAAKIAGANRIFRIGGAQAVAALAYGTDTIPAVDMIAGPGNIFVTVAKRLVSQVCAIDKEAGPSEVVVISDGSAAPNLAALELLAQAEHDEEARSILVTTSVETADAIQAAMAEEMKTLSRSQIMEASLAGQGEVFVVPSIAEAARLTNTIAPEHLSIQTSDPQSVFDQVKHVGCAVLGAGTSVAVGDYYAGPNHVLPTGGRARYASPLTAEDFRKVTSILSYSPERMAQEADDIIRLAEAEELTAHARAVEKRR